MYKDVLYRTASRGHQGNKRAHNCVLNGGVPKARWDRTGLGARLILRAWASRYMTEGIWPSCGSLAKRVKKSGKAQNRMGT
jgi:hypothetical protein